MTDATTLLDALASAVEAENDALSRMDIHRALTLLDEKAARVEQLRNTWPPETDADLVDPARRVLALAEENGRLLRRAIVAQSRLMRILADAAGPAPGGYTRDGITAASGSALAFIARA